MSSKLTKVYLVFDRKNTSETKGVGGVSIYLYFANKTKTYVSTGIYIKPTEWDKKNKEVSAVHENSMELNSYLRNQINSIMNHEIELQKQGIQLSKKRLEDFLSDASGGSFIEFAQKQRKASNKALATLASQRRSIEILELYYPKVQFSDLSLEMLNEFTAWMKNTQKYSDNQMWKVHKDIKIYVGLALKMNKIRWENNPYKYFKNVRQKHKTDYLTMSEVNSLMELEPPDGDGKLYRDAFLFACYTGLRISDLELLDGTKILKENGHLVLKLNRMVKVDMRVFQRLDEYFKGAAEYVIEPYWEKYGENKYIWGKKLVEQTFNEWLKVLQTQAGIKKVLTIHLGRHTFGTQLAKETGDVFKVMSAMGISTLKTAQIYINISGEL